MITGSTYLERGEPVLVTAAWNGATRDLPDLSALLPHLRTKAHGPRNCMIRRADGSTDVRPFRGLRRTDSNPAEKP